MEKFSWSIKELHVHVVIAINRLSFSENTSLFTKRP
jgi:hypothetical protein